MIRKFFTEPFGQFILLGAALFVVYQLVSPEEENNNSIVVSSATTQSLANRFETAWLRKPSADELQALVDAHIKEEILYREGLAIGLDKNDPVIRRRILQKLTILSEETQSLAPATDEELTSYMNENQEAYLAPASFSYQQVYFDPTQHKDNLNEAFNELFAQVKQKSQAGEPVKGLGDTSLLPYSGNNISLSQIERLFGSDFAISLKSVPVNSWEGPVQSGFGAHIVLITEKNVPQQPLLENVRTAVERDWENDRRNKASADFYNKLRVNYQVEVAPLTTELVETVEEVAPTIEGSATTKPKKFQSVTDEITE